MPRKPLHSRTIIYEGYLRDDGLWEIEGSVTDIKPYIHPSLGRGPMEPGEPIHQMTVRLALDDDYRIVEAECEMRATPFDYCVGASSPIARLVGKTLGRGWRANVDEAMEGVKGCTHLRELLYSAATPAFQSIAPYRAMQQAKNKGESSYGESQKPFFLDQCFAWDISGPVVKEKFPKFYKEKDGSSE